MREAAAELVSSQEGILVYGFLGGSGGFRVWELWSWLLGFLDVGFRVWVKV